MNPKHIFSVVLLISIFGCLVDETSTTKPGAATHTSGFIQIDSSEHYYRFSGQGDTIIVLHGGPGLSHLYLKPHLDSLLATQFTLLYYDQRGSGWSSGETDTARLNVETYVEDLDGLRKYFRLNQVNLLGHSFGGILAIYYAIAYPASVNSLVLVDPDAASYALRTPYQMKMINARISSTQQEYLDSIELTTAFRDFDPDAFEAYYKTYLTSYFADPLDTSKLFLGFDSISVPKIDHTNRIVRANLGHYDIHDRLHAIACRTLIMQGTKSVFSMEGAVAMHDQIPSSELHVFEDCGHFQFIERPRKFSKLIFDFYAIE